MPRWQRSFALGLFSLALLAVANGCAAQAREEPRADHTDPVFIYDSRVPADQRSEIEAAEARAAHWLESELGVAVPDVRITAAPDSDSYIAGLQERYRRGGADGAELRETLRTAAAVTVGHDVLVLTDSRWERMSHPERSFIVAHELFHVVQYQLASGSAGAPAGVDIPGPSWLIEGSADFVAASVEAGSGGRSLDEYRLAYRANGESASATLTDLEPSDGHAAWSPAAPYTLGFLATDALVSRTNLQTLRTLWERSARDGSWENAFTVVFGQSPDEFCREFSVAAR